MAAPSFTDLSLAALSERLGSRTRALAARRWLYACRSTPESLPARIRGVTPEAWARVHDTAPLPVWRLAERQVSRDGTIKYALEVEGATIETVLIPSDGRSTVCVSSQSGCTRKR